MGRENEMIFVSDCSLKQSNEMKMHTAIKEEKSIFTDLNSIVHFPVFLIFFRREINLVLS